MANVSPIEGITYGFRLMGYLIAVYLVAAIAVFLGVALVDGGSEFLGSLIVFIGILAFFAGLFGMGYKVIADGVEKGITAANVGVTSAGGASGRAGAARRRERTEPTSADSERNRTGTDNERNPTTDGERDE